ncbi:hypothetical protein T09_6018 [Trichinella sp. T9]|nr:hypothetical protein T09_6018 [Trichinella sp. T9]
MMSKYLKRYSEQEPNFHCYALNDLYTERSEIRWGILTTVRRFKLIIGEKNMEAESVASSRYYQIFLRTSFKMLLSTDYYICKGR